MREIEVKILNVDRNVIVNEISKLGAEKIFDGEIKTLFFLTLVIIEYRKQETF
jgi:hypothetical protein